MALRFAVPADFPTLCDFRRSVFRDELDVQEDTYEDVFNDYFSRTILVERRGKLLGSVRLAFSREVQEFYISYFIVAPEVRGAAVPRALLGAVFVLMKANGVPVVRADATDNNLPMYLAAGCKIVGQRFRKHGFRVEWTPLCYRLGTNPWAEARLMAQARPSLLASGDPRWRYGVNLRLCASRVEYKSSLLGLVAAKGISMDVPHFKYENGRRTFNADWLQTRALPARADEQCHTLGSAFARLNDHFSSEHLIVLLRQSRFADLAMMYSCLTRKRVIYLDSWSDPIPSQLSTAKTVLLLYAPDERLQVISSAIFRFRNYRLGIASGRDEEAASWFLLRNYFEFLGPKVLTDSLNNRLNLWSDDQIVEVLFCSRGSDCFEGAGSHAVLSVNADATVPHAAVELFVALLKAGYTTGDAVRFASLCTKQTLLIAGDPAVRLFPFRPDTNKMDEPNMTALKFPADESDIGVKHWFGPASSVLRRHEELSSKGRGGVWTRAYCTEASTMHLFEYRKSPELVDRIWQPFQLIAR